MSAGDQVNKTEDYDVIVDEFLKFYYTGWVSKTEDFISSNIFEKTLLNYNNDEIRGDIVREFLLMPLESVDMIDVSYIPDGSRRININVKGVLSVDTKSKNFVQTFLLCEQKKSWYVKLMHFMFIDDVEYISGNEIVEDFVSTYFTKLTTSLDELFSLPFWQEYTKLSTNEGILNNGDIVKYLEELKIEKIDMKKCQFIQDKTANISIVIEGNATCEKGETTIVKMFNLAYTIPRGTKKKDVSKCGQWVIKSGCIFFI